MSYKRYEIDTMDKLVNVATKENYGRLAKDLLLWLYTSIDMFDRLRAKHPELANGRTNSELANVSFNWVDDGKNDLKDIVLKNNITGEVFKAKIKKRKNGK